MNCKNCYYNFDGVCAYHSPDPDTYGVSCSVLLLRYPNGCTYHRPDLETFFTSKQCMDGDRKD